ncbi:unnamed protein product [Musa textilis]
MDRDTRSCLRTRRSRSASSGRRWTSRTCGGGENIMHATSTETPAFDPARGAGGRRRRSPGDGSSVRRETLRRIVARHYAKSPAAAVTRTIVEVVQLCHLHGSDPSTSSGELFSLLTRRRIHP